MKLTERQWAKARAAMDKLTPKELAALRRHHIEMVAEYVASFDRQVDHPYRLSGCILLKFNIPGSRPLAKNPGHGPRKW